MLIDEGSTASALMMSPMPAGRHANEHSGWRSKVRAPHQGPSLQRPDLDRLPGIFVKSASSLASSKAIPSNAGNSDCHLLDSPPAMYFIKADYGATNGNELSVFRSERVQLHGQSVTGEWVKVREMARGEEGWIPAAVLTFDPPEATSRAAPPFACSKNVEESLLLSGVTNVEPAMEEGGVRRAKKTVRFKDEPEILTDSLILSKSSSMSSLEDLPATQIATGCSTLPTVCPSSECSMMEDKQLLRVYAGNFDPEGGYRTILADESATLAQIAEQARPKFRHRALEASDTACYISIVHVDTGHALSLPSPPSTLDLATAIELAKKATLMQSPMPAENTKSILRLARRLARLHGRGRQPEWIQPAIDDRAGKAGSAGSLEDGCPTGGTNAASTIGLVRDRSTDFVTRYRCVLNVC